MMIVIIDPDPHRARALALRAKELGSGLIIFTADSPASAAEILRDLSPGAAIEVQNLDAHDRSVPSSEAPRTGHLRHDRG